MTTKIIFPGDPSLYKDIEALPLTDLVPMMKAKITKTRGDNYLLMTKTLNGLKQKFEECMRAEFDAVNHFILCAHDDSHLAMIFELEREYVKDGFKVNVSLCVKKKFGSEPVPKKDIEYAAKHLYTIAFELLSHPTIRSMANKRDIMNKVNVCESVWKKVKANDNEVDVDTVIAAAKDFKMKELKTALKKEVIEEMEQNGGGSLKPVIEHMIDSTDMTNFLHDVSTSLHNDPKKTLELMRTKMLQHLAARPDAADKSMEELAHLEIKESLERHRERTHASAQEGAAGAKEKKE